MNWIALLIAIEIGLQPFGHAVMNGGTVRAYAIDAAPSLYTDVDGGVLLLEHVYVRGGVTTVFWKSGTGFSFIPDYTTFRIEIGTVFGPLSVGFRHFCSHPVAPYLGGRSVLPAWEGSYEQVYVRLER